MNAIISEVEVSIPEEVPAPKLARPEGEEEVFSTLNEVLETNFYKPDLQATRIVLGTINAHYLNIGDPAWLFVVAPPGSGKTTTSIMGACGLPEVISLGDFSENTFLSGFYKHTEPGVLEKVGKTSQEGNTYTTRGNAIFMAKDFTTVLSMRNETRAMILAQLREIHDGSFKRAFGTGDTKEWRGRVTVVAAVTPAIDRHYGVFNVLGERFLQLRWHRPDSPEAGEWAIDQQGQEEQIRADLAAAVKRIFDGADKTVPVLARDMRKRVASLAEVVALGRAHVYRSSYGNREIEEVPEPEANTRLSKGLAAIARGVAALNRRAEVAEADLQDTMRVGLDCLAENRRRILLAAIKGRDLASISLARTVREREVENLEALGILGEGDRMGKLTERVEELLTVAALKLE
jgi:hypothetical protein